MDYLGYPVNRLIRISYGPFQLGNLQKGETAEINKDVVSNQLGLMNKLKWELLLVNIKEENYLPQKEYKQGLQQIGLEKH